jgi:hypothetical protein
VKPSPLSAVLADDLLLDRVGARLDTDDDLGALLLAVAHQADTPIPQATLQRRGVARRHRGLTVLAALGVAVSGATVAAAVELAPMPHEQASGAPHSRTFLPPSLQSLVMPFLAGTPFQGRLVLPFGALPMVPVSGTATEVGLPVLGTDPLALTLTAATPAVDAEQGNQEQQDLSRQKTQAKAAQTDGQDTQTLSGTGNVAETNPSDGGQDDQGQVAAEPTTKPTPTPTVTPTGTPSGTGSTSGQATGTANRNAGNRGLGAAGGGTIGETDDDGSAAEGDDPVSGGPDKHDATMRYAGPVTKGATTEPVPATTPGSPATGTVPTSMPSGTAAILSTAPATAPATTSTSSSSDGQ